MKATPWKMDKRSRKAKRLSPWEQDHYVPSGAARWTPMEPSGEVSTVPNEPALAPDEDEGDT